jgi:hypothetical protein
MPSTVGASKPRGILTRGLCNTRMKNIISYYLFLKQTKKERKKEKVASELENDRSST